jgi:hypothetical protein
VGPMRASFPQHDRRCAATEGAEWDKLPAPVIKYVRNVEVLASLP